MCDSKNLGFIKEQEASRLLSNLGLKTPLSKTLVLVDILFQRYKTNKLVNKFSLAEINSCLKYI